MASYTFNGQLAFSRGRREQFDVETIKEMIPDCVSVTKTDKALDRRGVDYIAKLSGGAEIMIDAKARDAGTSRFWTNGPELALESWSVMPGRKYDTIPTQAKIGWTLNRATPVDLILFTFDPSECDEVFLVSYQLLRMAFHANYRQWRQRYGVKYQETPGSHESECTYVPADVVLVAMETASRGRLRLVEPALAMVANGVDDDVPF